MDFLPSIKKLSLYNKIEILLHLLFWLFYFSSVNANWTGDWFDARLRPNTPAPLSVLLFPIFIYVNAFLLIPRYFSFEKWKQYLLFAFCLFIVPEFIRIAFYQSGIIGTSYRSIGQAITDRDSLLLGAPSPAFYALNLSFIYRLCRDWLIRKAYGESDSKFVNPYEGQQLLTKEEAVQLEQTLKQVLEEEKLFLDPQLTLRYIAEQLGSSDKKVSYLINQHMNSNFYDLINAYRIKQFKKEILKEENQHLSTVGVALNCGFSSKSSFYRAFKSNTGTSPAAYLKSLKNKPL